MTAWLVAAMIVAQSVDIGTTWKGLHDGCTERLYYHIQDPVQIAIGKGAGTTIGVVFVIRKGQSHPKLSKGLAAFIIGAGAAGAVMNTRTLLQGKCRHE